MINALAPLAAASRPVITTEIGWDNATFSQASVAQYVVQATLDAIKDGAMRRSVLLAHCSTTLPASSD